MERESFGGEIEKDQKHKKARPKAWPQQVITEKTVQVGPVHVVNFKELADSQAAHPIPFRTGFIKRGEDVDADFKFTRTTYRPIHRYTIPTRFRATRQGPTRRISLSRRRQRAIF